MRVSIIVPDQMVCKDGKCFIVQMPPMPTGLHAVQWYGEWGEEEWTDEVGRAIENRTITSFEPYEWALTLWTIEDEKEVVIDIPVLDLSGQNP